MKMSDLRVPREDTKKFRKTKLDLDKSNPDIRTNLNSVECMIEAELEKGGVVNGPLKHVDIVIGSLYPLHVAVWSERKGYWLIYCTNFKNCCTYDGYTALLSRAKEGCFYSGCTETLKTSISCVEGVPAKLKCSCTHHDDDGMINAENDCEFHDDMDWDLVMVSSLCQGQRKK